MIVVLNTTQEGARYAFAAWREAVPAVLGQLRAGHGSPDLPKIDATTRIVSFIGTTVYVNNIAFAPLKRVLDGEFTEMRDFFAKFPITPEVARIAGIAEVALGGTFICVNDSDLCHRIEQHVSKSPSLRRREAQYYSVPNNKINETRGRE